MGYSELYMPRKINKKPGKFLLLSAAFFLFFALIGVKRAEAAEGSYCWCKTPNGSCKLYENQSDAQGNIIATQGDCNDFCASVGSDWSFRSFDKAYVDLNKKPGCERKAYCWCKIPNGSCELHERDAQFDIIATYGACNEYCAGRGSDWSFRSFDQTYVDLNKKPGCQIAPAVKKDETSNKDLNKELEALKASAQKDLNPAKFGAVTDVVGRAIQLLLAFIGSIMIVLYIYAGILWMTAAGNSEQMEKAKQIFVWATLGVVVMLASYLIVSFVFKGLGL